MCGGHASILAATRPAFPCWIYCVWCCLSPKFGPPHVRPRYIISSALQIRIKGVAWDNRRDQKSNCSVSMTLGYVSAGISIYRSTVYRRVHSATTAPYLSVSAKLGPKPDYEIHTPVFWGSKQLTKRPPNSNHTTIGTQSCRDTFVELEWGRVYCLHYEHIRNVNSGCRYEKEVHPLWPSFEHAAAG